MVFQNYALYPTMTVKENIEFGLINNKIEKNEREKLIKEIEVFISKEEIPKFKKIKGCTKCAYYEYCKI